LENKTNSVANNDAMKTNDALLSKHPDTGKDESYSEMDNLL